MKQSMDKADIKDHIAKKIQQVEEHIEELKELTQPVAPDVAIGRVSRMDAINNKSVNEAALRQAKEKLRGLYYAYETIDKATFGVCTSCGGEIPLGRILIVPESTKCMRCS